MTERSYRAVKSVRAGGKHYEVGKVYDLPAEIGEAMPWLVAESAAEPTPAGEDEPQVVATSTMVLITLTGGAPDAETRAKLDELIAASQPLDVRVTLDELAARAIAGLKAPTPAPAVPEIMVHVAADKPLSPETAAALDAVARAGAAELVGEGTTAPVTGAPAPTLAAVNAALVDKDGDGKPDKAKKAKAAKADAPQT